MEIDGDRWSRLHRIHMRWREAQAMMRREKDGNAAGKDVHWRPDQLIRHYQMIIRCNL